MLLYCNVFLDAVLVQLLLTQGLAQAGHTNPVVTLAATELLFDGLTSLPQMPQQGSRDEGDSCRPAGLQELI